MDMTGQRFPQPQKGRAGPTRLAQVRCGTSFALCLALLALSLGSARAALVSATSRNALVAFRAAMRSSGSTAFVGWSNTSDCNSWANIKCNTAGDVIEMNMARQGLYGYIPVQFYAITTLQKIDFRGNQLFGTVSRRLADINRGLYYLDLSDNYFTGQYPDLWMNPDLTAGTDWPYPVELYGKPMYLNISYTYFSGWQTFFSQQQALMWGIYPYLCVGIHGEGVGSADRTCLRFLGTNFAYSGYDVGYCGPAGNNLTMYPRGYVVPQGRGWQQCISMCGAGSNTYESSFSVCNSRPNTVCVPKFVSSRFVGSACEQAQTEVLPSATVPTSTAPAVRTAQVTFLNQISSAFNNSLAAFRGSSISCGGLQGLAACDSAGNIVRLSLTNLNLAGTIPSAIRGLTGLKALDLSRNRLFGSWPAALSLSTVLSQLVSLDLSNNFLSGKVPTGFASRPAFLNYSNNYFSGDPTISYYAFTYTVTGLGPPEEADLPGLVLASGFTSATFCPDSNTTIITAGNCLTNYANSPCPGDAQRSVEACSAFCGTSILPSAQGDLPMGPCYGAAGVTCQPTSTAASPTFACSSTVTPPTTPTPPTCKPAQKTALLVFANNYMKYGTPAAVFSTWRADRPCSTWSGVVCDSDCNLVALNMKGRGLVGPLPGPSVYQNLFWRYPGKASDVRAVDLSNNQLYGTLDPLLAQVDIDYLDISNNFLTGPLPAYLLGRFKYFNFTGNYFTGSPALKAMDQSTPLCARSNFPGFLDSNCYDTTTGVSSSCPTVAARGAPVCKTFCKGGAFTGKVPCAKRTQVCRVVAKKFTCVVHKN